MIKKSRGIIVAPGAAKVITARLIEEAAFPVVYTTGSGLSNKMLGVADVGLISFKEVLDQVKYICDAVEILIIADGDTGLGDAVNVVRTVTESKKASVSTIQLEDQLTPKSVAILMGSKLFLRKR
ncbi:isocitrate lyase/phosphoenolpyruvate mutase family protein [Planococcus sp. ISL-109]|uniref:isocitrate lyase/phosphoenolpyruvate mutase family protein n=1 Tax=Planococcus sp. ISL-109 TaxID=2819166 RepID=UPI001BEB40C5|nr:isocitrate lyase/phosphoenolpyruvate mutase family protein [Planococcus sp. ISL-109]MBT2584038.1 isocitrate lyase/phosphoenolpyruvate mutase family protein [Planococcus sp. ISL-109]